jgi:hypothetical protein
MTTVTEQAGIEPGSWTAMQASLKDVGRSISTTGRKILSDEIGLAKLLEKIQETAASHPGAMGAFRVGALEGLLRLAITPHRQLDVKPLAALGFDQIGDTAARRAWTKILGRDLFMSLDELARSYLRWQRQFVVYLGPRPVDVAALAERFASDPVRLNALTGSLRNHRGKQQGVVQALGIEGAQVIWRKE